MNQENHKKGKEKFNAEETVSSLYPFIIRVFDVYEVQNSGKLFTSMELLKLILGTSRQNYGSLYGSLGSSVRLSMSLENTYFLFFLKRRQKKRPG